MHICYLTFALPLTSHFIKFDLDAEDLKEAKNSYDKMFFSSRFDQNIQRQKNNTLI